MIKHCLMALLYPRPLVGIIGVPRFIKHWMKYVRQPDLPEISLLDLYPCLTDWNSYTPFDAHYFYQGGWLARKVVPSNPSAHVDIGSSVLTISVLSSVLNVIFLEYRPLKSSLTGITEITGNILELPFRDLSVTSLSCLHVIEHIGLGRYGDPVDPQGTSKAARELQRVLGYGGRFYLSLPIGRERVCFNAHRVHAVKSVIQMFSELRLIEFSYVDDKGKFFEDQPIEMDSYMEYGCGLFVFQKPSN